MAVVTVVFGLPLVVSVVAVIRICLTSVGTPACVLDLARGRISAVLVSPMDPEPNLVLVHWATSHGVSLTPTWFWKAPGSNYNWGCAFTVPLVYPVAVSALAAWFAHHRVRAICRSTNCWGCGYDLRGSAGDVCPECGAAKQGRDVVEKTPT